MSSILDQVTPGPWLWNSDSDIFSLPKDRAVAQILAIPNENLRGTWDQHQARANAALIAEAPAMALCLELIRRGLMWIHGVKFGFRHASPDEFTVYENYFTYTEALNAIGWDRARAALAAAKEGRR